MDTTDIAQRHIGRPVPDAALLGSFAALTRRLEIGYEPRAIRERFPGAVGDLPRQHGDQAGPRQPLQHRSGRLQGLRNLRARMPVRGDRKFPRKAPIRQLTRIIFSSHECV
tara:strand:- start:717 stop:1049 length:333 start_codon:yes stop_codon:yes gene_type:complete